jgi:GT2 family glycosyltransferase
MSLTASIVIPTLNREVVLCETIESLLGCGGAESLVEILVIDQSPAHEPETLLWINKLCENNLVQYHRVCFRGTTKARNHGTRLARGDVIIFVDDDIIACPGFIQKHLKEYEDVSVAGVAGCVLHAGQRKLAECDLDASTISRVKRGKQALFNLGFAYEARWAAGCNMSYRREWIYKAGGFDENFYGVAVGEEPEFCHRLRLAGGYMRFAPDAEVFHRANPDGGSRDVKDPKEGFIAWVDNAVYCGLCTKTNWLTRALELLRVAQLSLINSKVLRSGRLPYYLSWCWTGVKKGTHRFLVRNANHDRAAHLHRLNF